MAGADPPERVRLDRWLWAARFFKSRSLATAAVSGGHVHVAGGRARPSRPVGAGDILTITRGTLQWTIEVLQVAERRGPAKVAAEMYRETDESIAAREAESARRKAQPTLDVVMPGRPTKRDRRRLDDLRRRR